MLRLANGVISCSERRRETVTDFPMRATLSGRAIVVPEGSPSPTSNSMAVVTVESAVIRWSHDGDRRVPVGVGPHRHGHGTAGIHPGFHSATSESDETAVTGATVTGMDCVAVKPLGSRTTTVATAVPGPTGRIVSTPPESLTLATVLSVDAVA